MNRFLCALYAAVACGGGAVAAPAPAAFDLKVEPVVLLEGGPVLVKLTLAYKGPRSMVVGWPLADQGRLIDIEVPGAWRLRHPRRRQAGGDPLEPYEVAPGEEFTLVVPVHWRYVIPAGRARLRFTWRLDDNTDPPVEGRVPSPVADLDVDIPPATAANVARLRRQMEAASDRLEQRDHLRETRQELAARDQIVKEVVWSEQEAFLPLGFRLMQSRGSRSTYPELRLHVYRWSRRSRENHAQLIRYLHDHGSRADSPIFGAWQADEAVLSDDDVGRLLDSGDLWIRAYTYDLRPGQCPKRTREIIEKELERVRELVNSLPK